MCLYAIYVWLLGFVCTCVVGQTRIWQSDVLSSTKGNAEYYIRVLIEGFEQVFLLEYYQILMLTIHYELCQKL